MPKDNPFAYAKKNAKFSEHSSVGGGKTLIRKGSEYDKLYQEGKKRTHERAKGRNIHPKGVERAAETIGDIDAFATAKARAKWAKRKSKK
jgi:hypothetical protein